MPTPKRPRPSSARFDVVRIVDIRASNKVVRALKVFMREWKVAESSVQVAAAADKLAAQLHGITL